jgi:hypothetical protein
LGKRWATVDAKKCRHPYGSPDAWPNCRSKRATAETMSATLKRPI